MYTVPIPIKNIWGNTETVYHELYFIIKHKNKPITRII